jgi:hypothetical protein
VIVHFLLYVPTLIFGCRFLSATSPSNPDRRTAVQKTAPVYNVFRVMLWAWTATVYAFVVYFAYKNKHTKSEYVYDLER